LHKKSSVGSKGTTESVQDQHWFGLLGEISCNFVDRVPGIRSQTIHKITLS